MSGNASRRKRKSDLLSHRRPVLNAMFTPESVAVIGATEAPGSVGRALVENLKSYHGLVYPVNLKRETILGVPAFPKIGAVPDHIDLAIIATPAATVPEVLQECAEAGVTGAMIVSAGFKECGPLGAKLEEAIVARRGQMRIVGPNCLGLMIPRLGLNATFAPRLAKDGHLAFVSQSGALCSSVLDWSLREGVGFSGFFSVGSMADVNWGDLIYYLADDWHTGSILIYMESVGDARSFFSAAREVALTKPIIVLKVGRTSLGAKAVMSHTGAAAGSDEVFDAAFRRAGILRVNTVDELFGMAEVLGKQPRPHGSRLAIVTNGGGPGALAADALIEDNGSLADLSDQTIETLNNLLPPFWSRSNPVDLAGDAKADQYAAAVEALIKDPNNDALLIILTPQATAEPTATAERLKLLVSTRQKPILACWMGGNAVAEAEALFNASGIPTFDHPDAAARAFCLMAQYSSNLRALYETPVLLTGSTEEIRRERVEAVLREVREAGRTLLTEVEAKEILSSYGIPVVEIRLAKNEEEAVAFLQSSVVLKGNAEITRDKGAADQVKFDSRAPAEMRTAYRSIQKQVGNLADADAFQAVTVQKMISSDGVELSLGKRIDPNFGPIILFGAGGQLVEVWCDRAIGLPPLNATLAKRLMERTRIYAALNGGVGRPQADLDALEKLLIRFSQLVAEQPLIKEIDVNPLLASPRGVIVLDARMILAEPDQPAASLSKLVIRPYPTQYVREWKLADGTLVVIRPIRPEDEPLAIDFHKSLSEETLHLRYFGFLEGEALIAHERLVQICFSDYDREINLVAERIQPGRNQRQIVAIARLIKSYGANEAELTIVISDDWQGKGLGTKLLRDLLEIGCTEGLERIVGYVLPENYVMQRICRKQGFEVRFDRSRDVFKAELELRNPC
jgi:acetyltransferase